MFKSRCIHIYTSKDGVIRLLLSVVESSHRGIPTGLLTCKNSRAGGAWLTSCEMQALPVLKYEKISIIIFLSPGKSLLSIKSSGPPAVLRGDRNGSALLYQPLMR